MAAKEISLQGALNFIRGRAGKMFSVTFTKRTTGETRHMVCRQGVRSHLAANPSKPGIDFKGNGLVPVFDMNAEGKDGSRGAYRCFPVEGLQTVVIDGIEYKVAIK
jgi:hypothetical protein